MAEWEEAGEDMQVEEEEEEEEGTVEEEEGQEAMRAVEEGEEEEEEDILVEGGEVVAILEAVTEGGTRHCFEIISTLNQLQESARPWVYMENRAARIKIMETELSRREGVILLGEEEERAPKIDCLLQLSVSLQHLKVGVNTVPPSLTEKDMFRL